MRQHFLVYDDCSFQFSRPLSHTVLDTNNLMHLDGEREHKLVDIQNIVKYIYMTHLYIT